jgi:tRNA pseudouridine13 synthase
MKLRQLPEDFKVEEINDFPILKSGEYKLYLLEKRGMETFYLLGYLSKNNNIPISEFGIAGLKDKHAVTKQYMTLPSKYELKLVSEKNFRITFIGYVDKPLKAGDLKGNRFDIVVREVKEKFLDSVEAGSLSVRQFGVPNYFDSQRFGSVANKVFVGRFLVKKDYEHAVKAYLTEFNRMENKSVKEDKKRILASWGDLSKVAVNTSSLKSVVREYLKTGSWLSAYKKIPSSIREMTVFAYQSYLWNECIRNVLFRIVGKDNFFGVDYNVGTLFFYVTLSDDKFKSIPKTFKTISADMKPTEFEKEIVDKVLLKEKVRLEDFDIKSETGNFFSSQERDIIVLPSDFMMSSPKVDELNDKGMKNIFKIRISFTLPKGSYATVITKRIFRH